MSGMSIGAIARSAGLAPSAIRYYEKLGLLPNPVRESGQRRYGTEIIGRLRIIAVARASGFTIAQTRTFLSGFPLTTPPAARWRVLAESKIEELDVMMTRITDMRKILESSFRCGCATIGDCERALLVVGGESRPGVSRRGKLKVKYP